MIENYSTQYGSRYIANRSWESPCYEQMLAIGAQAMYIACNDTSVIVINFRKSKTHAITDTYCTSKYPNQKKTQKKEKRKWTQKHAVSICLS